jgi:hypothetical protein
MLDKRTDEPGLTCYVFRGKPFSHNNERNGLVTPLGNEGQRMVLVFIQNQYKCLLNCRDFFPTIFLTNIYHCGVWGYLL